MTPSVLTTILFTICVALAETPKAESSSKSGDRQAPITVSETVEGETEVWGMETETRWRQIFPSNWGQAGIFRVRSAESLPPQTLTFGIGGEFYSISNGPDLSVGNTAAKTISEHLFAGYAFTDRFTFGMVRRNSSTTFGSPQQLISSLGDINFSGQYSIPLTRLAAIAPVVNVLVASNFNQLEPSGNTVSAGIGGAFSILLSDAVGIPLSAHANVGIHMPQIRDSALTALAPEIYFNFSRYTTVTTALGAELQLGDVIPFIEFHQAAQLSSPLGIGEAPSRVSVGSRFTPLGNKSLAVLLGADIGIGRGLAAGVPYTPGFQILGQLSYTVGLGQTERKHYHSTQDVRVVDRKYVFGKNINFKVNSAELESSSFEMLDQIGQITRKNNIKKLLVVGHTDSTHNDDYNVKLSQDRAISVKAYLAKQGVAEEVLMAQGYGKRRPKASNLSEEGRAQNRRVEFIIVE